MALLSSLLWVSALLASVKMGCECSNGVISRSRICSVTVPFVFLLVLASTQMRFMAEGRSISRRVHQTVSEEKMILRGQIGSRPPKCERRCSWCGHCEAIQVPTNPQVKSGISRNSSVFNSVAYDRDDRSNYKPMSWKCKCGSLIFNP